MTRPVLKKMTARPLRAPRWAQQAAPALPVPADELPSDRFTGQGIIRLRDHAPDRKWFRVHGGDITYHSERLGPITLPEGWAFDGASIPAPARIFFLPYGDHLKAAGVHDRLYWLHHQGRALYGRRVADLVFIDAMHDLDVDDEDARLMYRAVRVGGWWPWHKVGDKLTFWD